MPELIRYRFTDKGLLDSLVALGTTPDAAVHNLVAMSITGKRGLECECPLAVYLTTVIDGARRALVYQDDDRAELHILVEHIERGGPDITAVVSDPLATVVTLFDLGRYPQLEVSDAA